MFLLLLPLALHPWVGLDLLKSLKTRITKLCPIKICLNILLLKISTLLQYYAVYNGNSLLMV